MPVTVIQPNEYRAEEHPHRRIRWTPDMDDLHLNLVHLRESEEIGEHVNASLDVVLTCLDGSGTLVIDGDPVALVPGSIAVIGKGSSRGVIAGPHGMRYSTCHARRGGLVPTPSRQ